LATRTPTICCADNQVRGNAEDGILYFRNETAWAWPVTATGSRTTSSRTTGATSAVAGIRIRGETRDVVLKNNRIRDTRAPEARRQTTGIQLDATVGAVSLEDNTVEATVPVRDQRAATSGNSASKPEP
jgi:hypothetical protein